MITLLKILKNRFIYTLGYYNYIKFLKNYNLLNNYCINESNDVLNKNYSGILEYYDKDGISKLNTLSLKKVKTCAVVFNGYLKDSGHGELIDKCDFIIRINFALTREKEKDYGSKTNLRILGRDWIFSEDNETLIHTYNKSEYYKKDLENFKSSQWLRNQGLIIFNSSLDAKLKKIFGGGVTNGLRAVVIALSLSEKVIIFGSEQNMKNRQKTMTHSSDDKVKSTIIQFSRCRNLSQNLDAYFVPIKDNKNSSIHLSIKREYNYYRTHKHIYLDPEKYFYNK